MNQCYDHGQFELALPQDDQFPMCLSVWLLVYKERYAISVRSHWLLYRRPISHIIMTLMIIARINQMKRMIGIVDYYVLGIRICTRLSSALVCAFDFSYIGMQIRFEVTTVSVGVSWEKSNKFHINSH